MPFSIMFPIDFADLIHRKIIGTRQVHYRIKTEVIRTEMPWEPWPQRIQSSKALGSVSRRYFSWCSRTPVGGISTVTDYPTLRKNIIKGPILSTVTLTGTGFLMGRSLDNFYAILVMHCSIQIHERCSSWAWSRQWYFWCLEGFSTDSYTYQDARYLWSGGTDESCASIVVRRKC